MTTTPPLPCRLVAAELLQVWHNSTGFGAASGGPMVSTPGGFSRKSAPPPPPPPPSADGNGAAPAPAAAAAAAPSRPESAYPRIDPAVIMLITSRCGGWALLGRKREWPTDRCGGLGGLRGGARLEGWGGGLRLGVGSGGLGGGGGKGQGGGTGARGGGGGCALKAV